MMESSNGMSQGSDVISQPGNTTSAPTPAVSNNAPVSTPDERTFKQSEVNDIVKRAKYGAVEDFKRMSTEQPQYAQQKYGENSNQSQPVNMQQGTQGEEHLRKIAAEEAQRLRDQWVQEARSKSEAEYAQRIVNNFFQKVAPGKEKYQDFDQVTGDIDFGRFPNVVQMLSEHVDNSHDVLYELGKNRLNMGNLEQLALMSPKDAISHVQRLSQSLKDNDAASKVRLPNEPLSQIRPSNTGTGSGGALSMADLKAKYRG